MKTHVTDHFMVFVEYSSDDDFCEIKNAESAIMPQYVDYKKLNKLLDLESWDIVLRDCSANIGQCWTNFIAKIRLTVENGTENIKIRPSKRKRTPWITNSIIKSIEEKNRLYKDAMKNPL
ncbi:hypothetical protein HHI36_007947 [Cryptolaemus montrouzieri]|uniref:Uncharacterized protein n=1 Tax=Cryptolaemus montrouzieri TaxID=559131 RepID=A0ABD2MR80_9CUCU